MVAATAVRGPSPLRCPSWYGRRRIACPTCVSTDTVSTRTSTVQEVYRCHGRSFLGGLRIQWDMIAEELGIDAVEMRLRNALKTGERQATGSMIISCALGEAIETAAEGSGWEEKQGNLPYGRGIGMGANGMMVGFPMGIRGGSSAIIKFNALRGAPAAYREVDGSAPREGLSDLLVVVGGNVPGRDIPKLEDLGVARVFQTGSRFEDIVSFIEEAAAK
jgi:hypothetical protein